MACAAVHRATTALVALCKATTALVTPHTGAGTYRSSHATRRHRFCPCSPSLLLRSSRGALAPGRAATSHRDAAKGCGPVPQPPGGLSVRPLLLCLVRSLSSGLWSLRGFKIRIISGKRQAVCPCCWARDQGCAALSTPPRASMAAPISVEQQAGGGHVALHPDTREVDLQQVLTTLFTSWLRPSSNWAPPMGDKTREKLPRPH